MRDLLGSYTYAFITCGVMLLVGAVLAFALRAPKTEPIQSVPENLGGVVRPGKAEAVK